MTHSFCSSANNIEHVKSIHVSLIYLYDTSTQIPRPKLRDSSFPLSLQIELFETKLCGKFMVMKYSWINFLRKSFLRARSWKFQYPVLSTILSCIALLRNPALAQYLESENRFISRANKRSQIEFLILIQRYSGREISHVRFL